MSKKPELSNSKTALDAHAAKVKEALQAAKGHEAKALLSYKKAGIELIIAKKICADGEFGAWCKENFGLSDQTASRYMRLATGWKIVKAAQASWEQANAKPLGLMSALKLIGDPEGIKHKPPKMHALPNEIVHLRKPLSSEQKTTFGKWIRQYKAQKKQRTKLAKTVSSFAHDHGWLLHDLLLDRKVTSITATNIWNRTLKRIKKSAK